MKSGKEVTSPLLRTVRAQLVRGRHITKYPLRAVSDDEGEEEAWLDALEAGQVNERGYLPQKKDVSTLTARQVRLTIDIIDYVNCLTALGLK